MTNLVRFPHPNSPLILTEQESEDEKWTPFACALYKEIKRLKEEFGADDEIMVRVLLVLVEGWVTDLAHELAHEDGGGGDDVA